MKEVRFNMRIDPKLKKEVTAAARRRNMSLAALTSHLYRQIIEADRVKVGPSGDVDQV